MGGVLEHIERELAGRRETDARAALRQFEGDFTVTWVSQRNASNDGTLYFFLRPDEHLSRMFGIEREVLLVIAKRPEFQARIIQNADKLLEDLPARGRVESLLYMIVSPDPDLFATVSTFSSDSRQNRLIVPFQANEAPGENASALLAARLREHLFSRDLFDIEQPITNDAFFFGRSDFVVEMRDAIMQGHNLGIFGLRKTGKTSLLFKLERLLAQERVASLAYLDLQDTDLYSCRWWELLGRVCLAIDPSTNLAEFDESSAAGLFRRSVESLGQARWIVAFDEIEHIVPGHAGLPHWHSDFLHFWKTLRSVQNVNRHLTYIVAGVNASVAETPSFSDADNPVFSMFKVKYVPLFDFEDVAKMVATLGHFMGLSFANDVLKELHANYGGHPMVTRLACSRFFQAIVRHESQPFELDIQYYVAHIARIDRSLFPYAAHVLDVLKRWYSDEYQMLECLANGETEFFSEMLGQVPQYGEHLSAYGLVDLDPPRVLMPYLKSYLRAEKAREKGIPAGPSDADLDVTELLAQMGRLRNQLEPRLRTFIKQMLMARFGSTRWFERVADSIPSERRARLIGIDADVVLEQYLYFSDLAAVLEKHWDVFRVLEQAPSEKRVTKEQVKVLMHFVNGQRADAHARKVSPAELATLRVAVQTLDAAISEYID
jgi:hypothetical protein